MLFGTFLVFWRPMWTHVSFLQSQRWTLTVLHHWTIGHSGVENSAQSWFLVNKNQLTNRPIKLPVICKHLVPIMVVVNCCDWAHYLACLGYLVSLEQSPHRRVTPLTGSMEPTQAWWWLNNPSHKSLTALLSCDCQRLRAPHVSLLNFGALSRHSFNEITNIYLVQILDCSKKQTNKHKKNKTKCNNYPFFLTA